MLKIKDNVNLKELEKYGFKKYKNAYYKCKRNNYIKTFSNMCIEVDKETKWIISDNFDNMFRIDEIKYQDTLYDLIKADLVEKVGSDNNE